MNRTQKILTTVLWGLLVLVMVTVIGAGWWKREPRHTADGFVELGEPGSHEGPLFHVPSFSLLDQNGQTVTDQTFRGHPWIAAFIFTRCAGPCPMMTANMVKLQERVPDARLKLVSFTVDPKRDTPEVLKQYAENVGADAARWSFITGSEQAMADVAKGMLMPAVPATEASDIIHSTKFLLVDPEGGVHGIYDSDAEGMERLTHDATALIGEPAAAGGSPTTSLLTQPE